MQLLSFHISMSYQFIWAHVMLKKERVISRPMEIRRSKESVHHITKCKVVWSIKTDCERPDRMFRSAIAQWWPPKEAGDDAVMILKLTCRLTVIKFHRLFAATMASNHQALDYSSAVFCQVCGGRFQSRRQSPRTLLIGRRRLLPFKRTFRGYIWNDQKCKLTT